MKTNVTPATVEDVTALVTALHIEDGMAVDDATAFPAVLRDVLSSPARTARALAHLSGSYLVSLRWIARELDMDVLDVLARLRLELEERGAA